MGSVGQCGKCDRVEVRRVWKAKETPDCRSIGREIGEAIPMLFRLLLNYFDAIIPAVR